MMTTNLEDWGTSWGPFTQQNPAEAQWLFHTRDHALRKAALALIEAYARWVGSGAGDVEYEALVKAMDALREELSR